ncbi:MAG: TIGR03987 family protein [Clostridiaceae bacterium]|nr:TIGR03987 family protein [Clostridiaceae bacterium]
MYTKCFYTKCFYTKYSYTKFSQANYYRGRWTVKVTSGTDLHGITGIIAIVLMLIHAIWATVVLIKKNETMIAQFHRFSILVWIIWLVPFISGAAAHMGK